MSGPARPGGPPRVAEKIIVWLVRHDRDMRSLDSHILDRMADTVAGDLQEVYSTIQAYSGRRAAARWYWGQVVAAVPSAVSIRSRSLVTMLQHYLLLALRHFRRHWILTSTNLVGLGLAIAISLVAFLLIAKEYSYDAFHVDSDRIVRVGMTVNFGGLSTFETTPFPLASVILDEIPSVEHSTRFTKKRMALIRLGDTSTAQDVFLVGPSFFEMFEFPLAAERAGATEMTPGTVILSQDMAARLLGTRSAVGTFIDVQLSGGEWTTLEVVGVLAEPPGATNLRFDILVSESYLEDVYGPETASSWEPKSPTVTLLRLSEGSRIEDLVSPLNAIYEAHGLLQFLEGADAEELLPAERLRDAHLSERFTNRILAPNGSPAQLRTLFIIAVLALVVACINAVLIAAGLATQRTRETGLRNVFGARRAQQIMQHTVEHALLSLAGVGMGCLFVLLIFPSLSGQTGVVLDPSMLLTPIGMVTILALTGIIMVLAGGYPIALMLRVPTIGALKGTWRNTSSGRWSRGLVLFQFMVTMVLITGTIAVTKQLDHLQAQNLGMDPDQVLLQRFTAGVDDATIEAFRQSVSGRADVVAVSGARGTLLGDAIDSAMRVEHRDGEITLTVNKIDHAYVPTLGLELVAGRNLLEGEADSSQAVLVNEAFVELFGIEEPVGAPTPFAMSRTGPGTIVGVVKDFHFQSLRQEVRPLLMHRRPGSPSWQLMIRIASSDPRTTIAAMEDAWENLGTGMESDLVFLDDAIENQYRTEQRTRFMTMVGSSVSIVIALLGLMGVTSISLSRRRREVGIRKVVGASGRSILGLFLKEYVVILVLAAILSTTGIILALNRWLESYAFPMHVSWWIPISGACIVALAAVVVISGITARTSSRIPLDSLRSE